MNKFIIVLTVALAIFVGVASANKVTRPHVINHHGPHFEHEENEPNFHHHGGFQHHRNPLTLWSDEFLIEELSRRGFHCEVFLHGGHHIEHKLGHHGGSKHGGLNKGGLVGTKRNGKGKGLSAGLGLGAAGGIESSNSVGASIGSSTSLGHHGSVEGHKNSVVGIGKHLDIGQHNENHNENDAVHKHQVIDQTKTFGKDKNTIINDVDSFHNSNGHSSGNNFGLGSEVVVGKNEGGRIEGGSQFNHENGANFEANSDVAAEGAAGIGAGIAV